MVYCRLISDDGKLIRYAIGSVYSDITGEMVFDRTTNSFEITKQPEKEPVYEYFVETMLRRHLDVLKEGKAPEKMSYEI